MPRALLALTGCKSGAQKLLDRLLLQLGIVLRDDYRPDEEKKKNA